MSLGSMADQFKQSIVIIHWEAHGHSQGNGPRAEDISLEAIGIQDLLAQIRVALISPWPSFLAKSSKHPQVQPVICLREPTCAIPQSHYQQSYEVLHILRRVELYPHDAGFYLLAGVACHNAFIPQGSEDRSHLLIHIYYLIVPRIIKGDLLMVQNGIAAHGG